MSCIIAKHLACAQLYNWRLYRYICYLFPSNQPQNGYSVFAFLVFWKEQLGASVWQMYNWRTAKSTDLKWKKCSHILLTFLERRGGLRGVSLPLRVGWSIPALKSSQSVSWTVCCCVWCTWWAYYYIVQSVASACIVFVPVTVVYSIHIGTYCFAN